MRALYRSLSFENRNDWLNCHPFNPDVIFKSDYELTKVLQQQIDFMTKFDEALDSQLKFKTNETCSLTCSSLVKQKSQVQRIGFYAFIFTICESAIFNTILLAWVVSN